uniref:Uncharacterized protein n=1 Tax=Anguilla anguilla TaxID=7936 RepID=A0A0E9U4G0_ANGAN
MPVLPSCCRMLTAPLLSYVFIVSLLSHCFLMFS